MKTPEIIDEKIAQEFIKDPASMFGNTSGVDLSATTEITDEAAESLSKVSNSTTMFLDFLCDEIKAKIQKYQTLTKEIAEEFLKDPGNMHLSGYKFIEDAASEVLSTSQQPLYLTGLNGSVPEQVIKNLAPYQGLGVFFPMDDDEFFGEIAKTNESYKLFYACAKQQQPALTKDLEGMLVNQHGMTHELVGKVESVASEAISKLWNLDTNESQGLVCFELLVQKLWESVNEYAEPEGSKKAWKHIARKYWCDKFCEDDWALALQCSELFPDGDADARESVKYCLDIQVLVGQIIDNLKELVGDSQVLLTGSVNLVICKLREEMLDAKKEWGYMNEMT